MIGTTELLLIAVVILVLFGASAIPKFARSISQAKKEFNKGAKDSSSGKDEDKKNGAVSDKNEK
jgi:sec-independent protein translocase protein TatA